MSDESSWARIKAGMTSHEHVVVGPDMYLVPLRDTMVMVPKKEMDMALVSLGASMQMCAAEIDTLQPHEMLLIRILAGITGVELGKKGKKK